jgi:hypothetical protein
VDLEVIVRNVTDEPLPLTYLSPFFLGADKGSTVSLSAGYIGKAFPSTVTVFPDKELRLGGVAVGHLLPKPDGVTSYAYRVQLKPGKYQVGSDNVLVPLPGRDGPKLGTGYLDLELRAGK